ncbi:S24 family peptidase [Pectobacterium aroidearum]|uniref:S24 family peptidase n=1 Tax=Pectobacterium aroidearum TaxID=1201031 RepID=UPI003314C226
MQTANLIQIKPTVTLESEPHHSIDNRMVITMPDDSMSGTIERGDQLLIDTTKYRYFVDGIHYFSIDGVFFVKRLQDIGGPLLVISDNGQYQRYRLEENELSRINIIGRVEKACLIKTFFYRGY